MIIEKWEEYKLSKRKQYVAKSNQASQLGHDCLRYLVLNRLEEKPLIDLNLQCIFDEGNFHEDAILRELGQAGLRIVEQARPFFWKEYEIGGRVDAKILLNGETYPLEIKTSSPYTYDKINSIEDLTNARYPYLRKYPAQLTLYLLMDEKEIGFFIFKNKVTGRLKEIPIKLDYEFGESLLKKAEAINTHLKMGTLPDPIEYDEDLCDGCPFLTSCLPEIKREALEWNDDPELITMLDRYFELKLHKKEYDALDRELKKKFKEIPKAVVGDYLVTGKEIERKAYSVGAGSYWKCDISQIT